jgi:hypothetical protein
LASVPLSSCFSPENGAFAPSHWAALVSVVLVLASTAALLWASTCATAWSF